MVCKGIRNKSASWLLLVGLWVLLAELWSNKSDYSRRDGILVLAQDDERPRKKKKKAPATTRTTAKEQERQPPQENEKEKSSAGAATGSSAAATPSKFAAHEMMERLVNSMILPSEEEAEAGKDKKPLPKVGLNSAELRTTLQLAAPIVLDKVVELQAPASKRLEELAAWFDAQEEEQMLTRLQQRMAAATAAAAAQRQKDDATTTTTTPPLPDMAKLKEMIGHVQAYANVFGKQPEAYSVEMARQYETSDLYSREKIEVVRRALLMNAEKVFPQEKKAQASPASQQLLQHLQSPEVVAQLKEKEAWVERVVKGQELLVAGVFQHSGARDEL